MAENPFKALEAATEQFRKMTAPDEAKSKAIRERLDRESPLQQVDLTIKADSGGAGVGL